MVADDDNNHNGTMVCPFCGWEADSGEDLMLAVRPFRMRARISPLSRTFLRVFGKG